MSTTTREEERRRGESRTTRIDFPVSMHVSRTRALSSRRLVFLALSSGRCSGLVGGRRKNEVLKIGLD